MKLKSQRGFAVIELIIVIAILVIIAAIAIPYHHDQPKQENTGMGTVRSFAQNEAWGVIVHETDGGFVKSMTVCGHPPVWTGMRANIAYRWIGNSDCYIIDYAQR